MLKVNESKIDSVAIIEIEGEVDLYSSPEVRKVIMRLTKNQTPTILVNLGKVSYMDSSGVATLVEGLQQANKYGGKLKLANLQDSVKEVFELSRLDKVFDIYDNVEEALQSLKEDGKGQ
ncbi:MAG: anti-sigma factor antagonist [Calditrichaeota bacterium]|nr:MAG: anti-sigma factor antagonist [Calditrichota bacterium]